MTEIRDSIMRKLYGCDVWDGYSPKGPMSERIQGWNGDHPSLARLASSLPEVVVVDVGVWKGQSTINMGNAMRHADRNGCVIGIDTFLGSAEHWTMTGMYSFSRINGLPDLYATFMDNVYHADLRGFVVPLPQTSSVAAILLSNAGIMPDIVHIDAAHDYEDVLRDAKMFWELLRPGGHLVGDDYVKVWPGVIKAAGEFSAMVGQPLSIEGPKWILQKPA